jgi:hypothetical protein
LEGFRFAFKSGLTGFRQLFRELLNGNCWCLNEHESAALWKLFSTTNYGIAIQSTVERFARSFDYYPKHKVVIGEVQYIDYAADDVIFDYSDQ